MGKRLTHTQDIFCLTSRFSFQMVLALLLWGAMLSIQEVAAQQDSISFYHKQGRQKAKAGEGESALQMYRKAQGFAGLSGDSLSWAQSLLEISRYALTQKGDFDLAQAGLDSIGNLKCLGPLSPVKLLARRELAQLAMMQNRVFEARQQLEDLVIDCQTVKGGDSLLATSYEGLARALFFQGEMVPALEYSLEALDLYQKAYPEGDEHIALGHNTVAIMYMYSAQYETAIEHFLISSQQLTTRFGPEHYQSIQVKTNIGVLYAELGHFWKSLDFHRSNLPHLSSLPPLAHLNGLLNMGSTLIMVEEYDESLLYFDQSEAWLRQFPELTPDNYAYLALQRSLAYEGLGQDDLAIGYLEEAIAINQELYGPLHVSLLQDYMQQSRLRSRLGEFDAARSSLEKVLLISRKLGGDRSLQYGHGQFLMAENYSREQRYTEAISWFRKAEQSYIVNGNRFDLSKAWTAMAIAWRALGNWDSTLKGHQMAWEILLPEQPFALSPSPELLDYWTYHPMADLLMEQGKSLAHFAGQKDKEAFMKAALASYQASLAIADSHRRYFDSPASRRAYKSKQRPLLESAMLLALELGEYNPDHRQEAFLLAEKSKANNLRDQLRGRQALRFAGLPDSLREQEAYYRQRLAYLNQDFFLTEQDSATRAEQQAERYATKQGYLQLIRHLETSYPAYYHLKYATSFDQKNLLEALPEDEAMYSYWWGKNTLFIFRVYAGEIRTYRLEPDKEVLPSLEKWLAYISTVPEGQYSENREVTLAAFELYQKLLPDLPRQLSLLNLLPDGTLGYLPFESLLQALPESENPGHWPWLGTVYPIAYANAAEIWLEQRLQSPLGSANYLGFAPDFSDGQISDARIALGALSYNQEEVEKVAYLLKGKALKGDLAREHHLKNLGKDPVILHFATHAIADEQALMQSRIFFQADSADGEDGILHAFEVYGLNLNSPLAVLSACQTGKGPLYQGEGVMSLARAFQYAGSQRVLTTLWQSDDRAGAALVTRFFEELTQKHSAARALQHARQSWLRQSDRYHCHPYFWAGSVLVGDGGTIALRQVWDLQNLLLGGGGLLLLLLSGLLLLKMKSAAKP